MADAFLFLEVLLLLIKSWRYSDTSVNQEGSNNHDVFWTNSQVLHTLESPNDLRGPTRI